MHPRTIGAVLVLLLCVISSACAPNNPRAEPPAVRLPPEIRTVVEYPTIPPESLTCRPEPSVPDAKTDVDLALWTEALRLAGAECRAKLDAIRDLVATWSTNG